MLLYLLVLHWKYLTCSEAIFSSHINVSAELTLHHSNYFNVSSYITGRNTHPRLTWPCSARNTSVSRL